MKTMAEVLRAHWSASTHTESKPFVDKCDGCGNVIFSWGDPTVKDGSAQLAVHQAAALSAAGIGDLAKAWREGFEVGRRPVPPGPPNPPTNPYQPKGVA